MKKIPIILIFILLSKLVFSQSLIDIDSTFKVTITDIVIKDNNFYISTKGQGFYYSSNKGKNWENRNVGLPTNELFDIEVADTVIFVSSFRNGIYMSNDNGLNWHPINRNLKDTSFNTLMYKDSILYCGTASGGFFRFENYHKIWIEFNYFGNYPPLNTLKNYGSYFYAGTFNDGFFISFDKGVNWKRRNDGLIGTNIMGVVISGTNVFAGDYFFGVSYSTDLGNTWHSYSETYKGSVLDLIMIKNIIIIGTPYGVFFSTNYTKTWKEISKGTFTPCVYRLANDDTNLYIGTKDDGLWKFKISEIPVSEEEIFCNESITIFPLAFSDKLIITANQISSLNLYSISGKEVPINVEYYNNEAIIKLNQQINSGVYLVKITTSKGIYFRKAIKT